MLDIFRYIEYGLMIALGFFLIFVVAGIIRIIIGYNKKMVIPHSNKLAKFAIIIPARDESKVIEANLKSIAECDYPSEMYDIYIIVERTDDPTIEIAKKYQNTNIFFRENLNNVGKGYGLDECLRYIYTNNDIYDAFMIFDADNVVSKDFISKLNNYYQAGYDVACGKRENKDWNISLTSGASALTFTVINSIQNKPKHKFNMAVTISGTGFYFKADVFRDYCGWPFHTMTEDYELTTYSFVNGLKSGYVEDAIFYDEQPIKLWQSIIQRSRWVRGYFQVRKKYKKERIKKIKENKKKSNVWFQFIGGLPAIIMAVIFIIYLIMCFVYMIVSLVLRDGLYWEYLMRICIGVGSIYLAIVLFSFILFWIDRKTIKIKWWHRIFVCFYHPIFLFTYVIAAIRALFIKNKWEKIEHTINMSCDE
ncbi:MAG: glycosyltransferase family 2 protein [Anaeroplasma sp.]|nr:glycosyltransferase family 2 protein [Anaeroplasma sp.]